MSRNEARATEGAPLTDEQQETWLAYMRVVLRLTYEMHHQLQADSDLSLADLHVLNALADAPRRRMGLTDLAARIGWERSRLSHQLRRMGERGLVERTPSERDGRATDALLTDRGRAVLQDATPGHAALIRRMFFDGLDDEQLPGLRSALERIHEQVLETGTLPRPGAPQRRLPGLQAPGSTNV